MTDKTVERVWLRDLDGTGSLHVCAEGDPGAIEFVEALTRQAQVSDDAVVERVARAIARSHYEDDDRAPANVEYLVEHNWPAWKPEARAAIEAMPATNSEAVSALDEAAGALLMCVACLEGQPDPEHIAYAIKQSRAALAKLGSRAPSHNQGALSGSREPSPDGLGPSGFDPARGDA